MQWDNIGGSIPRNKSRAARVKEGTQLWTICCAFIRAVLMFCVRFEVAPDPLALSPLPSFSALGCRFQVESVEFSSKLKVKVWELVLAHRVSLRD